ncbi:MAG TPA: phosphotransferase [Pyrinomonadaceae bacterium]|nr:phosphotransferase [Pyrinomonadaceae bacterium]
MASQRLLAQQTAARDELARRIDQVSRSEFIERYVMSSLPEYRDRVASAQGTQISIVQNDGTGAATIQYDIDDSTRVFAKLYASDGTGAAHGAHSFQVLSALWNDGCGRDSRYRVSEPLGFYPEFNMLLIRGADGMLVASADSDEELAHGSREAARWIAQMHMSSVRVGDTRYPWEVYHKLMHRLAKAAANNPDKVDDLIEMSDRFEEIARRVKPHFVQAHGQYRHIHVFVADEHVTVIDLDRSRPSDPAQDLGEYIHRMRTKRYKASKGQSRAEEATNAFLEEYGARHPEKLVNLPYYWGYHNLVSLWRYMKSSTPQDPKWNEMIEFYQSEFERAAAFRWSE